MPGFVLQGVGEAEIGAYGPADGRLNYRGDDHHHATPNGRRAPNGCTYPSLYDGSSTHGRCTDDGPCCDDGPRTHGACTHSTDITGPCTDVPGPNAGARGDGCVVTVKEFN